MVYMDPVGQYAQFTAGLLSPFIQNALATARAMGLAELENTLATQRAKELAEFNQELQKRAEQEKLQNVQELASQLSESLPSAENTYVLGSPNFSITEPALNLTPRQGQGLLGSIPLPSFKPDTYIANVSVSPEEYQTALFQKTLPQMAALAAYGINAFPILSSLAKVQEETYKTEEQQAQTLQDQLLKAQRWANILPKLFPDMDKDTSLYLSLAIAKGDIKPNELNSLRNKDVVFTHIPLKDGRVMMVAYNKDKHEVEWQQTVYPDLKLYQQIKTIENQAGGGSGNEETKYQKMTIKVPYSPDEIAKLPPNQQALAQLGVIQKNKVVIFDPKKGAFYDPTTKTQIDPETGQPLSTQPAPNVFRRQGTQKPSSGGNIFRQYLGGR
mgnify:CR=1 FL=1